MSSKPKKSTKKSDKTQKAQSADGNTKIRARAWVYTWNNYTEEDLEKLTTWTKKYCREYAHQEETGENGTKHIQGYWYFANAVYFDKMKELYPKMHIEKAKNLKAAKEYCMKENTRTGKRFTDEEIVKDPLEGVELLPWQKEIVEICLSEPDRRTIHWYWSKQGHNGKTSLAIHLALKHKNELLYVSGKAADIKYGIVKMMEEKKNKFKIGIFDFTRSSESYISYEGIESIKNGIFFNTKFESGMKVYNPPHIICFANFKPDIEKLSIDRWRIRKIRSSFTKPELKLDDDDSDISEDDDT